MSSGSKRFDEHKEEQDAIKSEMEKISQLHDQAIKEREPLLTAAELNDKTWVKLLLLKLYRTLALIQILDKTADDNLQAFTQDAAAEIDSIFEKPSRPYNAAIQKMYESTIETQSRLDDMLNRKLDSLLKRIKNKLEPLEKKIENLKKTSAYDESKSAQDELTIKQYKSLITEYNDLASKHEQLSNLHYKFELITRLQEQFDWFKLPNLPEDMKKITKQSKAQTQARAKAEEDYKIHLPDHFSHSDKIILGSVRKHARERLIVIANELIIAELARHDSAPTKLLADADVKLLKSISTCLSKNRDVESAALAQLARLTELKPLKKQGRTHNLSNSSNSKSTHSHARKLLDSGDKKSNDKHEKVENKKDDKDEIPHELKRQQRRSDVLHNAGASTLPHHSHHHDKPKRPHHSSSKKR